MQILLENFFTHSAYSLIIVSLISFLESFMIIGLIFPGTVIMAGLGTLIGAGKVNFWQAWMAGTIGCLIGDWISFWIGRKFKQSVYKLPVIKNKKIFLSKAENALSKNRVFTIFIGRFLGPIRPLIPVVAGILNLPVSKFIVPNIIGCLFWPPFYFLPGIFASSIINIQIKGTDKFLNWLLLTIVLLGCLLIHIWYAKRKKGMDCLIFFLPIRWCFRLVLLIFIVAITILAILYCNLMQFTS